MKNTVDTNIGDLWLTPECLDDMEARGKVIKPTQQEIDRIEGRTLNRSGWYRAGGAVVCSRCKKEYRDHPQVRDYLWLRRICNGDLVKL